jgi:hypothetical protein
MSGNRVVYQNWIAELGVDPVQIRSTRRPEESLPELTPLDEVLKNDSLALDPDDIITEKRRIEEIRSEVQRALQKLSVQEREFVAQFYFIGKSYRELSEQTGRPAHKLEALHKRAVKKLKRELSGFVAERFGIEAEHDTLTNCPICRSPRRTEIDQLIRARDRTSTWKPMIKALREEYGLRITSPQVLIGHEKYHTRTDGA